MDALEQGWDQATTRQLVDLCHWRAANTSHHYYVASEPGRVVAYVGVYQAGTTAYVHSLFTHPAARGRGAGAALMLAVSDRGHAMGCQRITLECARDSRLPAYYARLGFRTVGEEWVWTKP